MTDPNPFDHGTTNIEYQLIDNDEAEIMSNHVYNAWKIKLVKVESLKTGAEINSKNFRITSNNNEKFLLKKTPIFGKSEELHDLVLMRSLQASGISVPGFIDNVISGCGYSINGEEKYRLYEFIEGTHYDGSREQLEITAQEIAKLHRAFRNLPEMIPNSLWKIREPILSHNSGMWFSLQLLQDKIKTSKDEFDRLVYQNIPKIVRTSSTLMEVPFSRFSMQSIHYDLHPHNVLFGDNSLKATIDFDSMRFSQVIRDVSFALHRFSRTYGEQTEMKNDCDATIEERARLFLDAYIDINPLSHQEIRSIPFFIKDEAITRSYAIIKSHYTSDTRWSFDLKKHVTAIDEASQLHLY